MWKPAPLSSSAAAQQQPLPEHVISSLQGRELTAADYDLLLELETRQRQTQSLPHFLLRLLPTGTPPPPSAVGESAAAGDAAATQPAAPSQCGICREALVAGNQPLRQLLGCDHVVHESCALSSLLEAVSVDGSAGEALAVLACPTCRHAIYPALTLRSAYCIVALTPQFGAS